MVKLNTVLKNLSNGLILSLPSVLTKHKNLNQTLPNTKVDVFLLAEFIK